jgi:hypothetical protein
LIKDVKGEIELDAVIDDEDDDDDDDDEVDSVD